MEHRSEAALLDDTQRRDTVWQAPDLAAAYLNGVRGAIPLAREQLDIMVRLIRAAQPSPRSILDLGCGDGVLGHALLDAFAEQQPLVVFADFSPTMLDAARTRLAQYPTARFVELDYAMPGWADIVMYRDSRSSQPLQFDVIVSGFSIHHQPDDAKYAVYQAIYGMLSPGGIFLNLEHVASPTPWLEQQFEDYFVDALYRYHAPLGKSRAQVATDFYARPDKDANRLTSLETQCDWLRAIGFEQVDCYLKVFELALFGGIKPADSASPLAGM